MSTREENVNKILESVKDNKDTVATKQEAVESMKRMMVQFDNTFKELAK